jgi:hypothetical protein
MNKPIKRKKSPSKQKGNRWERELAKFLGDTLGGSFMRCPQSGAFVGGQNASRKEYLSNGQVKLVKGDIIPPDNLPKLVIEAKSYKAFSFNQLVTSGDCKQLDEWISQTLDCIDQGDVWFTIFKINNLGSYICFDQTLQQHFVLDNYSVYKNYIVTGFQTFLNSNKDAIISLCS